MSEVKRPVVLDETGQRIALALEAMSSGYENNASRVHSLTETQLVSDTVFEVAGIPEFVGDISKYSSFGIQETGWYVFARIFAKEGVRVTAETTIEGAAGYISVNGNGHVDVAVRFDVAAVSQIVVIDWGVYQDTYVFRATDLAIRNLDYLTTFYVYDAAEFATWEYGPSGDATYQILKKYFRLVDGEYVLIPPTEYIANDQIEAYFTKSVRHVLTDDAVFIEGKTYYTFDGEDTYIEADVVVGAEIPAGAYYVTEDVYTQAVGVFEAGVTYYTKADTYIEADVVVGAEIPVVYVHSKLTFEGLTRNITYRFNEIIDCPTDFILPEIEDDCHGAWYEIRMRHQGAYSTTLVPPSDDVEIAAEHTQGETEGLNMVDLHYSSVAGTKMWRFLNTHSTFKNPRPAIASIEFWNDTRTEYTAGETINYTGIKLVTGYVDGTRILFANQANSDFPITLTPASGTVLTAEDTEIVATYTVNDITVTATLPITVTEEVEP